MTSATPAEFPQALVRLLAPASLNASIRERDADFQVFEELGFEPDGEGEHDFLLIRKSGANTAWVAKQLAAHAGVQLRDVGYAGLKDRHAITEQWFSVRRPTREGTDWQQFSVAGVTVVEQQRNTRKLRRGAHSGNRFTITLRANGLHERVTELRQRGDVLTQRGVPNYFGEQRFGHDGGNLRLATRLFAGERLKRHLKSHAISAARALIFNRILSARLAAGTWDQLLPGDLANLDGSGSVFAVDEQSDALAARCAAFDLHPTASLWGSDAPLATGEVAMFEKQALTPYVAFAQGLAAMGVAAGHRPLRVRLRDLQIMSPAEGEVRVSFALPAGAYATVLLAELVDYTVSSRT